MSKRGFGKLLAGVGLGAGLGLLFAPKKGSEMRKDLKKKLDDLIAKAKEVDLDEIKDEFFEKVDEIKSELDDLDKEKAIDIAKKKGNELKEKTEELLELAKEKGTPILQEMAKEVREKSIKVVKEVLKNLETKDTQPKESSK